MNNELKNDQEEIEYVSKTELKKYMLSLQALGERILELPEAHFKQAPLGELIRDEMELAKTMKNNNAKRRQLQRIGKLLREENLEVLEAFLLQKDSAASTPPKEKPEDKLEKVRALINDQEQCQELLSKIDHSEKQRLRQLIRNAQKIAKNEKYLQQLLAFID